MSSLCLLFIISAVVSVYSQECINDDANCEAWARSGLCKPDERYVYQNCKKACQRCREGSSSSSSGPAPGVISEAQKYDPRYLSQDLLPLAPYLGVWREEFHGKARFPTMPTFSYGEQIEFSIARDAPGSFANALNYSAHSWGHNTREELHSEFGFLTMSGGRVSLITAMSNGFIANEEGEMPVPGILNLFSRHVARVSFSRDLHVTRMRRTLSIRPPENMIQAFDMATITNPMQEHTRIMYRKIYP